MESSPADGAVVERTPDRVVIRFSTGIDSRSTRISLVGPSGSSSLLIEGSGGPPVQELTIPVPDQGRGAYLVRWDIVAGDGDRIRGRLRFRVRD
ncbi:MAG: copper resistance protein CopC [Labilithrix sp.]|nr:copper resistance protein CopC [Labilithrix sp.]MBX3221098.1 copper resistance protein CopC [Labilithrix sp.]